MPHGHTIEQPPVMPTLIRERRPTARKQHRCAMCNGPIEPGQTYRRECYKGDDGLYDFVICEPCETGNIVNTVYAWSDGGVCGDGVILEDAYEWAHETINTTSDPDHASAVAWLERYDCGCETHEDKEPRGE